VRPGLKPHFPCPVPMLLRPVAGFLGFVPELVLLLCAASVHRSAVLHVLPPTSRISIASPSRTGLAKLNWANFLFVCNNWMHLQNLTIFGSVVVLEESPLSSGIIKEQFTSPCPYPRTTSPSPWHRRQSVGDWGDIHGPPNILQAGIVPPIISVSGPLTPRL